MVLHRRYCRSHAHDYGRRQGLREGRTLLLPTANRKMRSSWAERCVVKIRVNRFRRRTRSTTASLDDRRNRFRSREKDSLAFGRLREELQRAEDKGILRFDWTKIGIKTCGEFCQLSFYHRKLSSDVSKYVRAGATLLLSSPIFVRAETGVHKGLPEDNKDSWDQSFSNDVCTQMLGPLCFRLRGEWKNSSLTGDSAKELISKLNSTAQTKRKSWVPRNLWSLALNGEECTTESRDSLGEHAAYCLCDRVELILKATGVRARVQTGDYLRLLTRRLTPKFCERTAFEMSVTQYGRHDNTEIMLGVTITKPSMNRLRLCLAWAYWLERGGQKPAGKRPDEEELARATQIMTEQLQKCLSAGTDEAAICDGLTVTAIKFDLVEKKIHKRKKRTCEGANDVTVGVVGFWMRTIPLDSGTLPATYALAAMAWRQLKLSESPKALDSKYAAIKKAAEELWLDSKSVVEMHKLKMDKTWKGSSVSAHLEKLDLGAIQDDGYKSRVFRVKRSMYRKMFPNIKCRDETIILKVMDYYNLEKYRRRWEEHKELYDLEVECYTRIWKYNRTQKPKIMAPRMYDHGFCCFDDDDGGFVMGDYMVLEDLGETEEVQEETYSYYGMTSEDNPSREVYELVCEQKQLLLTVGIDFWSMPMRNRVVRNGKLYVFDFERVDLKPWKG